MRRAYGPAGLLAIGAGLAALYWLERRRPLRRETEGKDRRTARNLVVAGLAGAAVQAAEAPVVGPLAALVERRRWGLVPRLPLPGWARGVVAVLLMDYTFYVWHVLVHRVPFLWRFHRVHHVDLDMDATTAVRFHFAEMVLSVPYRAAQVAVVGVTPGQLAAWQLLTMLEVLFHHSNVALPPAWERRVGRVVVTPRMHGIHHSAVEDQTNSNWSSGLTVWDWLHGTLKLGVPQAAIAVGVPAYRDPAEVTLPHLLALPFEEQRPTWDPPAVRVPVRAGRPERGGLTAG